MNKYIDYPLMWHFSIRNKCHLGMVNIATIRIFGMVFFIGFATVIQSIDIKYVYRC